MNINSLNHDEKLSLWYPAVSCVQKAVRRSLFAYARIPALIAWRVNPSRFKMRAFTILYEDCCRDYRLMKYIHQYIDDAWDSQEGMLMMVNALCKGYKSRASCNLNFITSHKSFIRSFTDEQAKSVHELIEIRNRFPSTNYETILQDFENHGYSTPDWLACALIRCNDEKWEREGQSFFVPYFYNVDRGQQIQLIDFTEPEGIDDTFKGLFLLNGIDAHTHAGKLTINSMHKKGRFDRLLSFLPATRQNKEGLYEVFWYLSSAVLKNYKTTPNFPSLELIWRNELITARIFLEYERLLPEINSFKMWAITRTSSRFIDFCNQLRNAY